jgi:hypothetical protein
MASLRIDTNAGVRTIVFARAERYNTITPELRDELSVALDEADLDRDVRVVLLRAEGAAFCAGFGLDWSTDGQARADGANDRVWDSVATCADRSCTWVAPSVSSPLAGAWLVRRRHRHGAQRRHHVAANRPFGYPPAVDGYPGAGLGRPARTQRRPICRRRQDHGRRPPVPSRSSPHDEPHIERAPPLAQDGVTLSTSSR